MMSRSLRFHNFRLSLSGSAAFAGLTAGLMFMPMLELGTAGGVLADRYPKHWIVLFSYAVWALLTGLLAGLTLSHVVQAWQVWQVMLVAAGLGVLKELGYPAQQPFVAEMVGPARLCNAISITSSVVQLPGLVGPTTGGAETNAKHWWGTHFTPPPRRKKKGCNS